MRGERKKDMTIGFVKIYRKILENPVICKDADHLAVWIYLLLNATHKDMDVIFKGQRTTLKPGQLIAGRKSISHDLCINEYKVKRVLDVFESEQQIAQQRSNKNRLITVLNWSLYQNVEQQNAQPLHDKCTTDAQQLHTNKNIKNVKNERIKNNSRTFVPPSMDQLTSFIQENNYQVNPETFLSHYEAVGWYVGKNKMKNWEAAVRGWHSRNKKEIHQEEVVPDYMEPKKVKRNYEKVD